MATTYETRKHPKSGETYACEIDEDGTIIRAAGPLYHKDATDEDSLYSWISNADYPTITGQWLQAELADAS